MKRAILLSALIALAACAQAGDRSFCFVQIADTQLGFSTGNKDLAPDIANFRKAVQEINRIKPAFVVISGDLTNIPHDPKQIRAFWQVAREIRPDVPLHLVAGNHDIGQATAANVRSYRKLFGPDWYSFSHGGCEFIVLDSCLIHDSDADPALRDEQRTWFENALEAARKRSPKHIFVFTHHPWFIKTPDEPDQYYNIPQPQRKEYLDLMKRHNASFAVAGHYHREALAQADGLTMITTSALSRSLGKDPVGLRIFQVRDSSVSHAYYPLDKLREFAGQQTPSP